MLVTDLYNKKGKNQKLNPNQLDDFIKNISKINWDAQSPESIRKSFDEGSPFYPFLEIILSIKKEFDQQINEQDAAEKEFQESQERYKNILENIQDGFYEIDLKGNITFYNTALCNILGYTETFLTFPENELKGMNLFEFSDPHFIKRVTKYHRI